MSHPITEVVRAMVERSHAVAAVELQLLAERDPDALLDATELARSIGWGCPYHKLAEFKVSPRGRHYVGCAMEGCGMFYRDRPPLGSEPPPPEPYDDDLGF